MHFKNGREAHNGDPVIHQDPYSKRTNVGMLIDIQEGSSSCNGTVVRATGACLSCVTISDCVHAEDGYNAVVDALPKAVENAAPAGTVQTA